MIPKRVCILTLGVGSGHLRASETVQRALHDGNDPMEVKVVDALDTARRWFHWLYVDPYWWMLRYAPWMWRGVFERRQRKQHHYTAPDWVFRRGCRQVLRQLKNYAPHLVIVTEIGAAEIAALGRREGWFKAPVLAGMRLRPVSMDFNYGSSFGERSPSAYETLLLDAIIGDATLYTRQDMVEASWRAVEPIENVWRETKYDFPNYPAGTWGPAEADRMLARRGHTWRKP